MKPSDIVSLPEERKEKYKYNSETREKELYEFMQSDCRRCELQTFNSFVTSDYNAYVSVAYKMGLMSATKPHAISLYTRKGKLYASKL